MYFSEIRGKLVCVLGNHDPPPKDSIWRFIGVRPVDKFVWEAGGRKICVMHGHQFDPFHPIFDIPFANRISLVIIRFVHKMDKQGRHIAKWMDQHHEKFSIRIANRAKRYARRHRRFDVIICGHAHKAKHDKSVTIRGRRMPEYLNCGCWNCNTCSLATVDEDGQAELHLFNFSEVLLQ